MARILDHVPLIPDRCTGTEDDSLDWLFAYSGLDLGEHDYRNFIKRIRTVVILRSVYCLLKSAN